MDCINQSWLEKNSTLSLEIIPVGTPVLLLWGIFFQRCQEYGSTYDLCTGTTCIVSVDRVTFWKTSYISEKRYKWCMLSCDWNFFNLLARTFWCMMYIFNLDFVVVVIFKVVKHSILPTYNNLLNKMLYLHSKSGLEKKEALFVWGCGGVLTHQLGICSRLFHWSVSSRWSCAGRDYGGGYRGHRAGCTRGHWRRGDRCRRTPQVHLTPDTELHLNRVQNHTHSHPRHSSHLSSLVSTNTLKTPERK